MRRLKLLVLLLLLPAVLLSACAARNGASAEDTRAGMQIETKFGTLQYPAQWENQVQVDQEEHGDTVTVSFHTVFQGQDYPLFQVRIGGEGTPDAELKNGDESNPVFIQLPQLEPEDELSQEESDLLHSMQEDVNYLIAHLG